LELAGQVIITLILAWGSEDLKTPCNIFIGFVQMFVLDGGRIA